MQAIMTLRLMLSSSQCERESRSWKSSCRDAKSRLLTRAPRASVAPCPLTRVPQMDLPSLPPGLSLHRQHACTHRALTCAPEHEHEGMAHQTQPGPPDPAAYAVVIILLGG